MERGEWGETGRSWEVREVTGKMVGSGEGLEGLAGTRRDWEELEGSGKKREVLRRSGSEMWGGMSQRAWEKVGTIRQHGRGSFI